MNKVCLTCYKTFENSGKLCTPCYQKQYHDKNKDKVKLKKSNYYIANKKMIDDKCEKYKQQNIEKVKIKNSLYNHKHKERLAVYRKKYDVTPIGKFNKGKKSAISRNLSWDISFEKYVKIIMNPCEYCKEDLSGWGGTSLDRIDNDIGYIDSNVIPCCGTCNNIRNRFLTREEMKAAMTAVLNLRKVQNGKAAG